MNGFGTSPFVLPNMFDKPGDALQQGLYSQERRAERQSQIDYRNKREKEADDWRKYQVIKDSLNPEDVAVGNATFDEWSSQETKRVMQEVMNDPATQKGSFVDLYGVIQSKWLPVIGAANKMKAGLDQIDANVKLAGTEDTNLATDKLAAEAKLRLVQDTMPVGAEGKRLYNTANYNPDKNYVHDLLNSEDGWRYVKGPEPLINYIKNYKTEDVVLEKHLPDQSIVPYKGKQSPFTRLNITPGKDGVIKSGVEPKMELITEDDYVTDEDGSIHPVKLIDKNIYEQHIEKIPANKKVMDALWNEYKEKTGIKSKNATEEEKRKRAFAVGVFEAHDPSQIPRGVSQHLPRNTTNNFISMGATGGGSGKGNLFDKIDLSKYGNPPQGRIDALPANDLPAEIPAALKAAGIDVTGADNFQVEIENGKIVAITPKDGKRIDKVAMANAQEKWNTQGQKQVQPDFETVIEKPKQPAPTTPKTKPKKDPLGLGL